MLIDKLKEIPRFAYYPQLKEHLTEVIAVQVDNVAKYYLQENDQEYWLINKDFPNIAPPWPDIFFEWVPPKYINSVETGFQPNSEITIIKRHGFLIHSRELMEVKEEIEKTRLPRDYNRYCGIIMQTVSEYFINENHAVTEDDNIKVKGYTRKSWEAMSDIDRADFFDKADVAELRVCLTQLDRGMRWICVGFYIVQAKTGDIRVSPVSLSWGVGNSGNFIGPHPKLPDVPVINFGEQPSEKTIQLFRDQGKLFLHVPFLSLSFMHCKNVKTVENAPPKKVQHHRKKMGRKPLVKYYTLEIDPMKEVLRKEGGSTKTGLKKALHICRGHFATYTHEAPLFGRVVGTFWKPMHVRGRAEHGIVSKDYAVTPGGSSR